MMNGTETVKEDFSLRGRIGRQWFKWRGISPVPLFLLMFLLPPDFTWEGLSFWWVIAGVVIVEGLRIWAVGIAGSVTRTRGDHIPELVHAGPFRIVRNPLYIANIILYTFAGLLFGHIYLSIAILIYSCLQYSFVVAYEEERLRQTFGEQYIAYQKKVPRWFISLKPAIGSSSHQFDLVRALRSERSTFIAIGVLIGLFFVKKFWW